MKRRGPPQPQGLTLEMLDEELAVFSWDVERPAADLTAAEEDVLARLARGASNREIAVARKSSERTVANQVASLLKKLAAQSRYELITRYANGRQT